MLELEGRESRERTPELVRKVMMMIVLMIIILRIMVILRMMFKMSR